MGWTSDEIPPRGIFGIEVPKHEGIYTTIHPDYITRVAKEAIKRKDLKFLSDIQIQSVLALCNDYIEFYSKFRHGEIQLASGELPLEKLKEAAKWAEKTIKALSTGLTYKDIAGRNRKPPLSYPDKIDIATKWKMFHDKGMQTLKPHFGKSYQKIYALQKLCEEVKKYTISYQANYNELDELVSHTFKKEPLLKVLFGYLTGIIKPPKKGSKTPKKKQFAYRIKTVNRVLQASTNTN
jgi:hypothetical protein